MSGRGRLRGGEELMQVGEGVGQGVGESGESVGIEEDGAGGDEVDGEDDGVGVGGLGLVSGRGELCGGGGGRRGGEAAGADGGVQFGGQGGEDRDQGGEGARADGRAAGGAYSTGMGETPVAPGVARGHQYKRRCGSTAHM